MMKRLSIIVILSAPWCLGILTSYYESASAEETERKVTRIRMTAGELRAAGVNIRTTKSNGLPNSCGVAGNARLSISNDMLTHFKARGFSLESLCLALSSHMRFDMETGKQLPLALLTGSDSVEVPLNFPDCFKGGTPYLDCRQEYEANWGTKLKKSQQAEERETARKEDADFRAYIAHKNVSGRFSIEDLGRGIFDSGYEWILASKVLPRGYGYALHGPEGDDPELEDVDLETYRKKSSSALLWSDKR
jgi:hypothetical protein